MMRLMSDRFINEVLEGLKDEVNPCVTCKCLAGFRNRNEDYIRQFIQAGCLSCNSWENASIGMGETQLDAITNAIRRWNMRNPLKQPEPETISSVPAEEAAR